MLLEQVRDSELAEADTPVAELIIGNIDDYGYLKASVEEIAAIGNVPGDNDSGGAEGDSDVRSRRAWGRGICASA